ncbi:unnamed protein product [Arabidopsis lyrata]|uniref:KIB1-4 beta-propeller domain-containing protein n=1 Tax=Arabidopsis lyrata subsp. lyrata TaxID=81972 RepID=D7LA82_ARALL|nr:hypothetical protein ARALYDRAFT_899444 [Arabidopsis lyrata subsp. lyrata]CAH8262069.1 unnamed protein product [Arabidopsis lyrata]
MLKGVTDLALRGYRLYMASNSRCLRVIDLSGNQGFEDVTGSNPKPMLSPLGKHNYFSITVTTAGEVLLVESTTFENQRTFRVYRKDPNADPDDQIPIFLSWILLVMRPCFSTWVSLCLLTIPLVSNQTLSISPVMTVNVPVSVSASLLIWIFVCSVLQPKPSYASLNSPTCIPRMLDGFSL